MHNIHKIITAVFSIAFALSFLYIPLDIQGEELEDPLIRSAEAPTRSAITFTVMVTAYSSTPDQTDDTPFITASGERVRDGIIASNFLPFDTEVRIPELFGDKVFVVKDRMHPRKTNFVDVWMETTEAATHFGIHEATIEVLAGPDTPPVTLSFAR